MDQVEVPRDARTLALNLWSPQELYELDMEIDIMQCRQNPVKMSRSESMTFRPSQLSVPFEHLHRVWSPYRRDEVKENDELSYSLEAKPCGSGITLWTSSACGRTFVVRRSVADAQLFRAALELSFPFLTVPTNCDGQDISDALCRFSRVHHTVLSSYVPYLFFFFEENQAKFAQFGSLLKFQLDKKVEYNAAIYGFLRPKVSRGWFSFGSSSSSSANKTGSAGADAARNDGSDASVPQSLPEQLKVIEQCNGEGTVSPSLKETFLQVKAQKSTYDSTISALNDLLKAVSLTWDAIQTSGEGFVIPSQSLANIGTISSDQESFKMEVPSIRSTAGILQQRLFTTGWEAQQQAKPYVERLKALLVSLGSVSSARERHVDAYVALLATLETHSSVVSGKEKLPKGSPAAEYPAVFQQVKDFYSFQCSLRDAYRRHFEREMAYAQRCARDICVEICQHLFRLLQLTCTPHDPLQLTNTLVSPTHSFFEESI